MDNRLNIGPKILYEDYSMTVCFFFVHRMSDSNTRTFARVHVSVTISVTHTHTLCDGNEQLRDKTKSIWKVRYSSTFVRVEKNEGSKSFALS